MIYLVLANVYLAVFYAFYRMFLRRQTFFRWNRLYLLSGLLFSALLPLLAYSTWGYSEGYGAYLGGQADQVIVIQPATVEVTRAPSVSWQTVMLYGYLCGCFVALILFMRRLNMTLRMLRNRPDGGAFSFFGAVRVDTAMAGHERISQHEDVHAREWHSMDILLMELVKISNWFNPIVYRYARELRMQHEYIADEATASEDQFAYAELLVAKAMRVEPPLLAHTFSNNKMLKRRVAMLLREKSPRRGLLWYALLIPVVAGMGLLAAACSQQTGSGQSGDTAASQSGETAPTERSGASDAALFSEELGEQIVYSKDAQDKGTQGTVAFTFEKSEGGRIEKVNFLNELWEGQQAGILEVLRRDQTTRVAPVGKYLVTVSFRISGTDGGQEPPPPPVPAEYVPLPPIVIIGHSPDVPPPPPVKSEATQQRIDSATQSRVETPQEASAVQPEITEIRIGDPEQVFQSVEIQPEPRGGMRAFMTYIGQHYDYPQAAIDAGVNGQVQISFVVERDGSLSSMKVVKDLGYGTGEAALRVLREGDKWSPGIQNGRPVRVAYTLPIRLNLQQ